MEFSELEHLEKIKIIQRCENLIIKTLKSKRRICDRCKRKKHPKGFALVRGSKDRKKICRACENTIRAKGKRMRKTNRQQARTVKLKPKAEQKALRNPVSYAPILCKRL